MEVARDYTGCYPKHEAHLGVLTDCDSSGVVIGLKIKDATRIGIGLNSITEMIDINRKLGLDLSSELSIENLVETTSTNSHWNGLKGILSQEGLSDFEKIFYTNYLSQRVDDVNDIGIPFIEWLKTNRIELNTILAIAKPEPFWNWLKHKLLKLWPDGNYNRVISKPSPDEVYTPAIKDFITRLNNTFKPLIDFRYAKIEKRLNMIKYFIKDTDIILKKEEIMFSKLIDHLKSHYIDKDLVKEWIAKDLILIMYLFLK